MELKSLRSFVTVAEQLSVIRSCSITRGSLTSFVKSRALNSMWTFQLQNEPAAQASLTSDHS